MPTLLFFLSWAAYFAAHSLLASDPVKAAIERVFPGSPRYYRLIYNTISIAWLSALLLNLTRRPADFLFAPCLWSNTLGVMLAVPGGGMLAVALWQYNLSEFIGFEQLDQRNTSEHAVLQTSGLNARVRHPVYAAILLFLTGLWLIFPGRYFLAVVASVFVYLPFGIYFEEKKLLRQFGEAYVAYQKRVKRLIPGLW